MAPKKLVPKYTVEPVKSVKSLDLGKETVLRMSKELVVQAVDFEIKSGKKNIRVVII